MLHGALQKCPWGGSKYSICQELRYLQRDESFNLMLKLCGGRYSWTCSKLGLVEEFINKWHIDAYVHSCIAHAIAIDHLMNDHYLPLMSLPSVPHFSMKTLPTGSSLQLDKKFSCNCRIVLKWFKFKRNFYLFAQCSLNLILCSIYQLLYGLFVLLFGMS